MTEELAPGKDILGYCMKCKLNLAHTITSMVEDEVSKVTCNTCGKGKAPKKFRPPKTEKKKAAPRATKKSSVEKPLSMAKAATADVDDWNQLNKTNLTATPPEYALAAVYGLNECITHPKFGVGFINKVINDKRMEVLFESGRKMLIMNYKK